MWTPFLEEADQLMQEEKVARHNNDAVKLADICKRILQHAYDHKETARLCEFIIFLTKRRGQAKKAVIEMNQLAMTFLDKMPDRQSRMQLIQTIREATEGKFFVEAEYARCTRFFAEMKEQDGDLQAAADSILDVQVETYGSMEQKEKLEYILYQL